VPAAVNTAAPVADRTHPAWLSPAELDASVSNKRQLLFVRPVSANLHTLAGKIPAPLRARILAPFNAFRFFNTYFGRQTMAIFPTLIATGETHNFTYDLTERNVRYPAETIAVVTGNGPQETAGYIEESDRRRRAQPAFPDRYADPGRPAAA
jgi:hypothetical protein